MKRKIAVLLTLIAIASASTAQGISESDEGTYEWLNVKGQGTGVLFRLVKQTDGAWAAEGKLPNRDWESVSCGADCTYRETTAEEVISYFPQHWLDQASIYCIQNLAQAFCRYDSKSAPEKTGYLTFVLVTGKPIPIILKRFPDQIVQPVTVLKSVAPSYPPLSSHLMEQGTVMLRVNVQANGAVGEVKIQKSSGSHHLDAAAVEAVKKSQFRPAQTQSGKDVGSWVNVPYEFVLKD